MAEYIERESIYKILLMENPFGWNNDDLAELFREAKAADVVPVVRCKDCKLRNSDNCAMYYHSNESGEQYSWNYDNDFCSWGKAMELEKTD